MLDKLTRERARLIPDKLWNRVDKGEVPRISKKRAVWSLWGMLGKLRVKNHENR